MPVTKYRPYLSRAELSAIVVALKSALVSANTGLIKYLDNYLTDIDRGNRAPNHTTKPTFIESLQLEDDMQNGPGSSIVKPDPHELFYRWKNNPGSIAPAELPILQQYRYECDLMSIDEETEYERSLGI